MIKPFIIVRSAKQSDLGNINRVVEAAVMTWNLPDRVKRLSLPSYFYNNVDFNHFEFIVAIQNETIIGVVACEEADPAELPKNKTGLLLHGIYVHPDAQQKGNGALLLKETEKVVKEKDLKGLLVKAQKDAVSFFKKQGMKPIEITNPNKDYENRFWKDL